MPKFLTYKTEQAALDRGDVEGQARNLPYWQDSTQFEVRRYNAPFYTADEEWALEVTEYTTLTDEEETQVVNTLNMPE
jgi:hypothetical protein